MTDYSKKAMKIVSALMIVMIMISTFSMVFAADSPVKYDPSGWDGHDTKDFGSGTVGNWVAGIMQIVSIIGSGIAVIALIILGIKYMMGSVEEKAEYKKTMLPYVIGALMVFGASVIVGAIAGALTSK